MTRTMKFRSASLLALCAGVLLCLTAGGCYHRVVSARGLGAGAYDVSQPYQENSKLDDWVFGEKPSNDKIVRTKPQE